MSLALLVPAFNAAAFLPRLLESAHRQTIPFDEIIVYDDCSSDDTSDIASRMGALVLRGESNVGCSAGKNILAARARSDWIHFHDADDELMPHFVERACSWLERPVDVVLFAYEERDDLTGRLLGTRRFDPADVGADARSYAIREQINPFCGLYRRDAVLAAGGYDEDPRVLYNEDVAFHIRLALAGLRFAADEDVTVINHRRLNSMSGANGHKCLLAQLAVLDKTLEDPRSAPFRREIGERLWALAGLFGACGDWVSADVAIRMARSLSPPAGGSRGFRWACRISPRMAVRAREALVRLTRPQLRANHRSVLPQ